VEGLANEVTTSIAVHTRRIDLSVRSCSALTCPSALNSSSVAPRDTRYLQ
jgi:hypothetical protein